MSWHVSVIRCGTGYDAMKQFSLSEAAKVAGVSKSTIFRAVKTGKISAERDGSEYRIDASELFRVFPVKQPETVQRHDAEPHVAQVGETAKDVEIRMLRELLDAKDQQIETLQQSLRLIEKMVPEKSESSAADVAVSHRGWWSRLTGR